MEVREYIQQRLEQCSKYILPEQDQKILENHGIEEYIFRKLMSKKFRKWSLPESVQEQVREQIHYCVENQKPITLSLSYGGFKLWRLPTTPEVDWSEFFYIAYHVQYMTPIAKAYKPGVHFDFSSGDIAVTTMNNVPREDVDQYDKSLRVLIDIFLPHLTQNISIGASRLRDLFTDEQQFIDEGEKLRAGSRERMASDEHYADEFKRGAIQNLQLVGGSKDISGLSDGELQNLRDHSAEVIESMYFMPQIAEQDERGVVALMATNITLDIPMITTGTTKHSSAKFWAGLGVLAKNKDGYAAHVVTPKQWEKIKNATHETIDIDLIPLKNFKQILVYPKKFYFSN